MEAVERCHSFLDLCGYTAVVVTFQSLCMLSTGRLAVGAHARQGPWCRRDSHTA
jgi:hypothetical protein